MSIVLKTLRSDTVLFLSFIVFIVGLFTAEHVKAIPTIGLSGMLLSIILSFKENGFYQKKANKRILLAYSGFFFFYLFSFYSISDGVTVEYWQARTVVKVPFLVLPLAAIFVPGFSIKKMVKLYSVFFYLVLITSFASLVNYIIHYNEINVLIGASKSLPVVINHVRYSLFVVFSIFTGAYLTAYQSVYLSKYERYIHILGTFFLILFLHIAAVRIGLFIFYFFSAICIIYYLVAKRTSLKRGFLLLVLLFVLPGGFYLCFDSVQNKVENTITDLSNVTQEDEADKYSLTSRYFSYKVGLDVFSHDIWFGVGIPNLEKVVLNTYIDSYPNIIYARFKPHNQYLFWLSSSGIIGFIALFGFLILPSFYLKKYDFSVLGYLLLMVVLLSFLVENTVETQIGSNFTILFCVLPFLSDEKRNSTRSK